ncbi:transcriptional regulator, putative [Babesia ovata]|uniref:Transcriptional regulator, putative n=1 Tax=Babesia ovata TaxID=189622 RepID=A0A2H6K715_9APIC|nr:transcriptional regulator, putative [Babesia ovata]GBE58797.1 transcriptional regulator, putative [Babesia ovata]
MRRCRPSCKSTNSNRIYRLRKARRLCFVQVVYAREECVVELELDNVGLAGDDAPEPESHVGERRMQNRHGNQPGPRHEERACQVVFHSELLPDVHGLAEVHSRQHQ